MDIKLLKNFLQIARLGSMTQASRTLFITQSALSKQMKELEEEFGRPLFSRGSGGMNLTEEGMLLRKRAEDIVSLFDKTKQEFEELDEITGGDVHVGAPESCHMDIFARELLSFRKNYPGLRCHIISGMTVQVEEMLDRGLLDFIIISGIPDLNRYNHVRYPADDEWGIVVRKDHPLAKKERITFENLLDQNLIISTQGLSEEMAKWCGQDVDKLKITDTVNLAYNGSVMVKERVCIMLSYRGLVTDSELIWIPLHPKLSTPTYLLWRKYQVFTPVVELFLKQMVNSFEGGKNTILP